MLAYRICSSCWASEVCFGLNSRLLGCEAGWAAKCQKQSIIEVEVNGMFELNVKIDLLVTTGNYFVPYRHTNDAGSDSCIDHETILV